jgi:D-alanine-D-alanine ligase
MSIFKILHLVGSAANEFYCNLSLLYAKECLEAISNPSLYQFYLAYITPDGQWRFPASLSEEDIKAAKPKSLSQAIEYITTLKIDLVLPQKFCLQGMTQYRSLFDLLKIPYLGNKAEVMAIAADKGKTKAIVAAAGVKVPQGELLRRGDNPTIKPPVVIKPTLSDNSLGVTLVKETSNYDSGLKIAFEYSEEVLVEKYIEAGREVRCGIIVQDGKLVALPLEEYLVNSQDCPIRSYSDKLKETEDGKLTYAAKDNQKSWIVDPSDPITEAVQLIAKKCHQALGCRYYSLFDFRIDPQGQPWFLEAGLYCSFSPKSVIPTMAKAKGISVDKLFYYCLNENP